MNDNIQSRKLGIVGLSAIVFGSIIGVGIFNIAQNMAAGAAAGAVLISWGITAFGILFLVFTFRSLSRLRPDLNAGIYQYAQVGYGNYVGFNIAWGYWLCTAFGNVAYSIMLNDALGAFWPVLLQHGWPTVAVSSTLVWVMYFLVTSGIRTANRINVVMTAMKLLTLLMVVVILCLYFRLDMFTSDFWETPQLGDVLHQVETTMLVTLWCFIGIEGAVVMAARAKRSKDVGRASVLGFVTSWILYLMVSVLCFGVMSQASMANLPNPSVAYVLRDLCGDWAYYFVITAIIVSLLGGWVSWTLICAQVPMEASVVGILPKAFLKMNKHDMPAFGLLVATVVMQIFIILVVTANSVYMAALELTGMMVLPAYLFCGLFLIKASFNPHRYLPGTPKGHLLRYRIISIICTIYCLWLIYAGGLELLLITSLFYLPGVYFYITARKDARAESAFTTAEKWLLAAIILCAGVSIALLLTGIVQL